MRKIPTLKERIGGKRTCTKRLHFLDSLRGFAVLHMICYHMLWDMVHLFSIDIPLMGETSSYVYQQCICWTFILLSGFCSALGRPHWQRGVIVSACGAVVTAVTWLFMPDSRIVFGILTFLGVAMLSVIPLQHITKKCPPVLGAVLCFFLFLLTRNIPRGSLDFEGIVLLELPSELYRNYGTSFLGFQSASFFSTDYFPLFPWIFLFYTGHFLCRCCQNVLRQLTFMQWRIEPLAWIGRHALPIYLLHQPLGYAVLYLLLGIHIS